MENYDIYYPKIFKGKNIDELEYFIANWMANELYIKITDVTQCVDNEGNLIITFIYKIDFKLKNESDND